MSNINEREAYRNCLRRFLSGGKTDKREKQNNPPARCGMNMGELCRMLGERFKEK